MLRNLLAFVAASSLAACVFAAQTTTTATTQVSPQATELLAKVKQAYTKLTSLQHTGKVTGEFDVDGQREHDGIEFTSSFSAPNLFRLEIDKSDVIGSNGQKIYVYLKNRNMYFSTDAPKDRTAAPDLPEPFADLIHSQDPSLGLVISPDPAAELSRDVESVEKIDDVKIGETSYPALRIKGPVEQGIRTLLFDPSTNLLRQVSIDLTPQLKKRGAVDVKKALVTIDYPSNKANPTTQPEQFAWVPPPGARDAADTSGGGEAEQLVGKPAPAFKLKDSNDQEIASADFKGKVVVLDFWATWCGPCVYALPKVDALAKEFKEAGVVVYAVNQGEEKELVTGFMSSKNLTLPVLFDSDFKTSEKYRIEGIPTTFVIGKDGIVRKVFVGAGPDTESKLRDAINVAVNAAK